MGLVSLATKKEADMGSEFDYLDDISFTNSPHISGEAKKNRTILLEQMNRFGFTNYHKEWWHYTLNKKYLESSPFGNKSFDFNIKR